MDRFQAKMSFEKIPTEQENRKYFWHFGLHFCNAPASGGADVSARETQNADPQYFYAYDFYCWIKDVSILKVLGEIMAHMIDHA